MSPATAAEVSEALRPLLDSPQDSAIFCDVDGTLATIVERAEQAHVPESTSRLLGRLGRIYRLVACVSGRSAAEARRLVGVGTIAYAGSHGAELIPAGATRGSVAPGFAEWEHRVRRFGERHDGVDLRRLKVRREDKGAINAFHWRGAPDEEAARARVEEIATEAEAEGLAVHRGRKVVELRPPVPVDKGKAVRELIRRSGVRVALFGGDDATDLDAFAALDALAGEGRLDSTVRVGVRSAEGPSEIVERADLVVDDVAGFARVLARLAEVPG